MNHLPIFLGVAGRSCLVVGGGQVALRKVELLRRAGARVTVVAPSLVEPLRALFLTGAIALVPDRFSDTDVAGHALVYAATGDRAADNAVAAAARAAKIPVNVVDDAARSDFITPAIVDRSPVVVAVSSGGAAPVLARRIRAMIEALLPAGLGRLAARAGTLRRQVAADIPADGRRRWWEDFFAGPAGLPAFAAVRNSATAGGRVSIVGAGPGDPDLLTLRALQRLQDADVIVHDRLVGRGVLDYARRDAELIDVGKARGRRRFDQAEINALLAHHAARGRHVVRLKGGDPFIFGRGGEERAYLRARGVAVEIVPGITAALGAAASAGIPLTHRGVARAVTVLTGATAPGDNAPDGLPNHDWTMLAQAGGTLAVYMGLDAAPAIAGRLIAHGRDAETPVAVIENATLPEERVFTATLATLGDVVAANAVKSPALLLIGEAVREAGIAPAPLAAAS